MNLERLSLAEEKGVDTSAENTTPAIIIGFPSSDQEPMLNDKQLYALIVVSEKSTEFQGNQLENAKKALQQVEQQIVFWQNQREQALAGINEVRGAIIGCDTLISDELAKYKVSREMFERQKADYYKTATPKE